MIERLYSPSNTSPPRRAILSIEFVLNKETKATFPASLPLAALLDDAIFNNGAIIYSGESFSSFD